MTPGQTIAVLALRLRNADPQNWDRFLVAFAAYTDEATVVVTEAQPADILVAQGRAQQCRALLRIFRECDASSTKPAP